MIEKLVKMILFYLILECIHEILVVPLFEINKNWKHPIFKQNIKNLIFLLSNKDISSIKQI